MASEIYLGYRGLLPLAFLIGLAVVTFVIRDRSVALWKHLNGFGGPVLTAGPEIPRTFSRVIVPYWIWMIACGVPWVIFDAGFGAK